MTLAEKDVDDIGMDSNHHRHDRNRERDWHKVASGIEVSTRSNSSSSLYSTLTACQACILADDRINRCVLCCCRCRCCCSII